MLPKLTTGCDSFSHRLVRRPIGSHRRSPLTVADRIRNEEFRKQEFFTRDTEWVKHWQGFRALVALKRFRCDRQRCEEISFRKTGVTRKNMPLPPGRSIPLVELLILSFEFASSIDRYFRFDSGSTPSKRCDHDERRGFECTSHRVVRCIRCCVPSRWGFRDPTLRWSATVSQNQYSELP